jgi:carbamoylphosphate synthase large subunit
MIKNILITSGGTGGGFTTAKILKEYFSDKIKLFITDINPSNLVSSSIFADKFIQSPKVKDPKYIEYISSIVIKHKIDIIIPFIDQDIYVFSELYFKNKLSSSIYLQIKNPLFAKICSNKLESYKWMVKNKFITPSTFELGDQVDLNYYLIKPKTGFGSKVFLQNSNNKIDINDIEKYIGQEICENPEITIDVFYSGKDFYCLCRERIETKEGVCTKARVFYDIGLASIAKELAVKLELNYFCFQVMNLNGRFAITDINPRLGAGSSMGQEIGMDFYKAMVFDIMKMDYKPYIKQFLKTAYITRQYQNILTQIDG